MFFRSVKHFLWTPPLYYLNLIALFKPLSKINSLYEDEKTLMPSKDCSLNFCETFEKRKFPPLFSPVLGSTSLFPSRWLVFVWVCFSWSPSVFGFTRMFAKRWYYPTCTNLLKCDNIIEFHWEKLKSVKNEIVIPFTLFMFISVYILFHKINKLN